MWKCLVVREQFRCSAMSCFLASSLQIFRAYIHLLIESGGELLFRWILQPMTYHEAANQIWVGKPILVQVMAKVSGMEEQFQAHEQKAGRCWVQCLPVLWHTRTISGGQSSSGALVLVCEQSLCHGTHWLCVHDPIHNLMPPWKRRKYLGLVVRFLFSFLTREYGQKRKAALQKQSANRMQKKGIRAGFSSKPWYCLILNC